MLTQPTYRKLLKDAWKTSDVTTINGGNVVIVRNEQDAYLHPEEGKELASKKSWEYITLPGHHDDIWINPEPYVAFIMKKMNQQRK